MVKDCMEDAQVAGMAGVWGGLGANQELIRSSLSIRVIPVVGKLHGGADLPWITMVQNQDKPEGSASSFLFPVGLFVAFHALGSEVLRPKLTLVPFPAVLPGVCHLQGAVPRTDTLGSVCGRTLVGQGQCQRGVSQAGVTTGGKGGGCSPVLLLGSPVRAP